MDRLPFVYCSTVFADKTFCTQSRDLCHLQGRSQEFTKGEGQAKGSGDGEADYETRRRDKN